jgi:hypothetical protein
MKLVSEVGRLRGGKSARAKADDRGLPCGTSGSVTSGVRTRHGVFIGPVPVLSSDTSAASEL